MKCWEAFLEIHHTKVGLGCPYMGFFEGLCVKMTPRRPADPDITPMGGLLVGVG